MRKNLENPIAAAKRFKMPPDELKEYLDSGELKLAANCNMRLENVLDQGPAVGQTLFSQVWRVAHAHEKTSFVTGDNPFGIIIPDDMPQPWKNQPWGISSPEVVTAFPISCRTCLIMQGIETVEEPVEKIHLSRDEVREINLSIIKETETYALARDENSLEESCSGRFTVRREAKK